MNQTCVCVLAFNEQRHIADTLQAIVSGNGDLRFDTIVYANGCTDGTASQVKLLRRSIPNIKLRELARASKPGAWNAAFAENEHPIIVFSDGDVHPEPGCVQALWSHLEENPDLALACPQIWPLRRGLTLEQRLTGFLQIPLAQDFLTGGFYAVRRSALSAHLNELGFAGIPEGIVGEDEFLEEVVPRAAFAVVKQRVYYEPPALADYWKYLARLRWQEEQRRRAYGDRLRPVPNLGSTARLVAKLARCQGPARTLLGLSSTSLRVAAKAIFRVKIDSCYRRLGPVCRQGRGVLCRATRSVSAK